jgi:hypothetical protein
MGKFGSIMLLVRVSTTEKEREDLIFYNHYIQESEKCLILSKKLLVLSIENLRKANEYG